jgi:hypothetical protein
MDFWIGVLVGFVLAVVADYWVDYVKKEQEPEPEPEPVERVQREVGDVLLYTPEDLPVLLTEKLSHNKFRGCFITPDTKAKVKDDKIMEELKSLTISRVDDPILWPKYPHELSDLELANIAKARLTQ